MSEPSPLYVTWLAPEIDNLPPLEWLKELGELSQIPGIVIESVTGNVSLNDVARALNKRADIVIWSGHGEPAGLMLSNNDLVRPQWFSSQVLLAKPFLVILAACGSQDRTLDLVSLTDVLSRHEINAIGFPAKTNDKAASRFIVECVRAARGGVVSAFTVGLESITNTDTAKGIFLTPGIKDIPFGLVGQLEELSKKQNTIVSLIEHLLVLRGEFRGSIGAESESKPATDKSATDKSEPSGIQSMHLPNRGGHIRSITGDKDVK